MSFTLKMSGVIVGRSELETRDSARRTVSGVFRPGLGYDLVQPIFDLYDGTPADPEALARYRKAREALRLELAGPSGTPVSVRELHVRRDRNAAGVSSLVLEVETDDPSIWADAGRT
jgi:hypothetical protein